MVIIENGAVGLLYVIIILLITIPIYALSIYNIDCLTKGSCETWSWILVILNCIFTFLIIIVGIISSLSNGGNSNRNSNNSYYQQRRDNRVVIEDY